jgi:hypothetical protein
VVIALAPFLLRRPFFVQPVLMLCFLAQHSCEGLWRCVASVFGSRESVFFRVRGVVSWVTTALCVASQACLHDMSWHVSLAAVVLWLRKNGYWIVFSCFVVQQTMYKGKCAECNAHWHSKAFKSRPAGYDLPVASERRLGFVFESATNNKICGSCNQKNVRLMKRDRDEKEDQKVEEAKMARLDENGNTNVGLEVLENADVAEKEGTAISVLLFLSTVQ